MATVSDVVRTGDLEEFELPDWATGLPERPLYVCPQLFVDVEGNPAWYDGSIMKGARTPLDHLEQLFVDFRCAKRPAVSGFKRMMPTAKGIWKCHPEGARVFGWCAAPWTFVAVSAVLERDVKAQPALYREHMNGVQRFIKLHSLQNTVLIGDQRAVFPRPER